MAPSLANECMHSLLHMSLLAVLSGHAQQGPPAFPPGDQAKMVWVRELSEEVHYVGWKLDGRMHGLSSIKVLRTGSEYHGVFQNGLIDGAGKFVRQASASQV